MWRLSFYKSLDSTLFSLWWSSGYFCFTILIEEYRSTVCFLLVWSATHSPFDRVAGLSGRAISRGTTLPGLKPASPFSPFLYFTSSFVHPFFCSTFWLNPPCGALSLSSTSLQPNPTLTNAYPPASQQNQRGNGGINYPPQSLLPRLSSFSFLALHWLCNCNSAGDPGREGNNRGYPSKRTIAHW